MRRHHLALALSAFVDLAACAEAGVAVVGARSAFTSAEAIDLAVSGAGPIDIRHEDGSVVRLPAPGRATVLTVPAGTLKAGAYDAAGARFAVHPAEHGNAYWTAQWSHGSDRTAIHAKGGWMSMNGEFAGLHARPPAPGDIVEDFIAARMRPYALMVLSGGHQLDLDHRNDWGDPYVQRAIIWRAQRAALSNRIHPIAGLHMFDEPGLTWWPVAGGMTPFAIPHQLAEFTQRTGASIPIGTFADVGQRFAPIMDDWLDFMAQRMRYLEQAWHASRYGVDSVHPRFTTLNQVSSSYAPGDTTDGVDSRQNRAYDVLSGHGGYPDQFNGTLQPVISAEAFQGFSRGKPHYFLPMWGMYRWSQLRNFVWLSWTTKLEGIMYDPNQAFAFRLDGGEGSTWQNSDVVLEIAEINRRLALVGGVMNQLPKTLAPIAVLHSDRQFAHDVATHNHPRVQSEGVPQYLSPHSRTVSQCFVHCVHATGTIPNWIDEAEAVDGGAAFLKRWRVIYCPLLATATPAFAKALTEYVAGGGTLVQFADDALRIPGAFRGAYRSADMGALAIPAENASNSPGLRETAIRDWLAAAAPTFAADLAGFLGERPYACADREVILGVHGAGEARYLLFANNRQQRDNTRGTKHELIAASTAVRVPAGGVIYDLFRGGRVAVSDGGASLRLGAGDSACWLHLPAAPGAPTLTASATDGALRIAVAWGTDGFLPFRLRITDPAGNTIDDLYRATTPGDDGNRFTASYPIGVNATPGTWSVRVDEWLEGTTTSAAVEVGPGAASVSIETDAVTLGFDDARRIADLVAGTPMAPDFAKLNWQAPRVMAVDPRVFAVFGDPAQAGRVAAALTAKGMSVQVNPAYAIEPIASEEGYHDPGVGYREVNGENIRAHAIVLPGHPLIEVSHARGLINRMPTASFPGAGRAYVQWAIGAFQPGWQDVFVLGDAQAGVDWLLAAIAGTATQGSAPLTGEVVAAAPRARTREAAPTVAQRIACDDTPMGIASSADGQITYVLQYDGTVRAHDASGAIRWRAEPLIEGQALALSPRGDRIAVSGFPGVVMLDAATGGILGSVGGPRFASSHVLLSQTLTSVTWNDAGTLAAAGWNGNHPEVVGVVIVDANGAARPAPTIASHVRGVAFVPGGDVLLVGAAALTAVDAASGAVLWSNPDLRDAMAFAFADATAAVGCWSRRAGAVDLATGKTTRMAEFESIVGGVALLPDGDVVAARWGGSYPLTRIGAGGQQPFFQSRFGFQDVRWSPALGALVAAEQGGVLWLIDAAGQPTARLDDAGTTVHRLDCSRREILVGRMDRVVQRLTPP